MKGESDISIIPFNERIFTRTKCRSGYILTLVVAISTCCFLKINNEYLDGVLLRRHSVDGGRAVTAGRQACRMTMQRRRREEDDEEVEVEDFR